MGTNWSEMRGVRVTGWRDGKERGRKINEIGKVREGRGGAGSSWKHCTCGPGVGSPGGRPRGLQRR